MNRAHAVAAALLLLVAAWLASASRQLAEAAGSAGWGNLLALSVLYIGAHLLRMMRLALLTLDTRSRALPVMAAHALTAFPSSFLPYKLGEVLRLAAFSHVYGGLRRAAAVWLVERFCDILVIAGIILGLYLLDVDVPQPMRVVFVLFVGASALGLLALFSVSKVLAYLNGRLVLTSHSERGLALLRASHGVRQLEADIHRSVEGRFTGVLLLSLCIWALEVLALALFLGTQSAADPQNLAVLFAAGLLASLPGGYVPGIEGFGLYQSIGLVALCLGTLALAWLRSRALQRQEA